MASGSHQVRSDNLREDGAPKDYVAEPGTYSKLQEGWFYPRDLVSLRPGKPLIFHGRADDVMILNGINIFPSAIEDTLESHPDVKEAVAYAIKSRVHGEIPAAAVVLKDTVEMLSHCRQALGIRAPRQIAVVDRIPRNSAAGGVRWVRGGRHGGVGASLVHRVGNHRRLRGTHAWKVTC
jgi:acyl-coenzyme A synthetase/AMP-(fatty) acid ligase